MCLPRFVTVLLLAAIAYAPTAHAQSAAQDLRVSDLRPINLHPGVNHVGVPGNRHDAIITLASRADRSNQVGQDVYQVLLQAPAANKGSPDWRIVPTLSLQPNGPPAYIITEDPSDAANVARSIRFVQGRIGGRQQLLLVTATREAGQTGADPSSVAFIVYQLTPESELRPILTAQSTIRFCNSEKALQLQFGLKPRPLYSGPATTDGCPPAQRPSMASLPTSRPPVARPVPPPPPPLPNDVSIDVGGPPPPPAPPAPPAQLPAQTAMTAPPAATPPKPTAPECQQVVQQQRLALCESLVFGLLGNKTIEAAKRDEWTKRAGDIPQCVDPSDYGRVYPAATHVYALLAGGPKRSPDKQLDLIVAGCLDQVRS